VCTRAGLDVVSAMGMLTLLLLLAQTPAAQPPRDWEATEDRAYALQAENRTAEAIALLERTVKAAPDFAQAHFVLAEMLVMAAGLPVSDGTARTVEQRRLLERAVPHYTRAQALEPHRLADIVPLSLFRVYDEGGLDSPPDVERVVRVLVARNPASVAWRDSLAEALARQSRWREAVDTLLEASRVVPADERMSFGMVMADFARTRPSMPLVEARRLLGAADAVAGDLIAAAPNDRGGWMLRSGATGMLAERLPPGAERAQLEKTSASAFDRFMALAPKRASGSEQIAFVDPDAPPTAPPTKEELRKSLEEGLIAARTAAAANPADDALQAQLASYLWEVARDVSRPEPARRSAVDEGLRAAESVLARNTEHLEATVYRGLLLKQSAALQTSPARRDALLAEAAAMQARGEAITKQRRATPP
jgi:tetratricopeptide (TPR) repeat protein